MRSIRLAGAALALQLLAPAAFAQDTQAPTAPQGDNVTIGIGAAYAPTYEGSDDYNIAPAGIVRGQVSGFNFFSRATALYFDVAREEPGSESDFLIGPMVNFRFDRSRDIDDPAVERLGELDMAFEAGAFIGFGRNGLLNPYDYAQARLDFVHDVTGTHDGYVITPSLEYGTPLSRTTYVGAALSADYASGEFADTYYSVDPVGAVRSGLPVFDADDGFKNLRLTLLGNQMLSGDLIEGGLSIFAVGSYSRMFGDFERSPLVDGPRGFEGRGNADQFFAALGLAYTF